MRVRCVSFTRATFGKTVNKSAFFLHAGMATLLGTGISLASAAQTDVEPSADELTSVISALDSAAFEAFNNCSMPGQLEKHATYFSPDVEFYHDNGGVTWNRQDMIANTGKHVCGNFRRELIPGTLKVYPIKDFGAIEVGAHQFCQFESGSCDGMADFVIVWRLEDGKWLITRVLSYGHRPTGAAES
jgi:hypothetical protein